MDSTRHILRDSQALRRILILQLGLVVIATLLVVIAASIEADQGRTIGFFWFAFLAGCFGSSIGIIRRTHTDRAFLAELGGTWTTLLVPHLYGGLLAGLTYFLFVSGILSATGEGGLLTSNLFPDFKGSEGVNSKAEATITGYLDMRPSTIEDAGKLMVWGFVAGYSEGFVIGVLDHLRRGDSAEPAKKQTGGSANSTPPE